MNDEQKLRELLWLWHLNHAHSLYGDDGEMQCGQCFIDFKRDRVELIQEKLARYISNLPQKK